MGVPALFQEALEDGNCRCLMCPHQCKLKPGQSGICRVRLNNNGSIVLNSYGQVSSLALDPIEKKPLYHYYPGRVILSAGSWGCNFSCPFCQNYNIAHGFPSTNYVSPDEMLEISISEASRGSIGLAFTYNEPLVWFEYIQDTARLLKEHDLKVVLVTNGYINPGPLEELLPVVDAANVDLKAFNTRFYRHLCKANIEAVKENIKNMAGRMHLEVTTLVIPGENDSDDEMESLSKWLAEIDRSIPLHLSAYHPAYKMTVPHTPAQTMRRMRDIAGHNLNFVYTGNLPDEHNDTMCVNCGQLLIERRGYRTRLPGVAGRRCSACQAELDYIKGLEE